MAEADSRGAALAGSGGKDAGSGLEGLAAAARAAGGSAPMAGEGPGANRKIPPVHLWNPDYCGEIDMRIARDGTWFYAGTPIGRPALVQLFATILRKDPERYVLVTPVERVGIVVEDAPFLGVEMRVEGEGAGRTIALRTNVEDWVRIGPDNPLRFEKGEADGLKPYVRVRGDLWALVKRALFYDLVALGEVRDVDGIAMFGVASGGAFFPMERADRLEGLA